MFFVVVLFCVLFYFFVVNFLNLLLYLRLIVVFCVSGGCGVFVVIVVCVCVVDLMCGVVLMCCEVL